MKILYIAKFDLPDYQSDMVFHGVRSLFGPDVVDHNEAWYMYDDMMPLWKQRAPNGGDTHGRGFGICGKLPKLNIDRNNLSFKIKTHYFDTIIYGSFSRCTDFLSEVFATYKPNEIVMIDGEDDQWDRAASYSYYGRYFKRELPEARKNTSPINFCISKDLIVNKVPEKTQDWATLIPQQRDTYIFQDEKSYYKDYQKSYVAVSKAGQGWDCQRHYEILANGCIPFFPNLELCPEFTLIRYPKKLVLKLNNMIKNEESIIPIYEESVTELLDWTRKWLTTESVAKYVLNI